MLQISKLVMHNLIHSKDWDTKDPVNLDFRQTEISEYICVFKCMSVRHCIIYYLNLHYTTVYAMINYFMSKDNSNR